MKHENHKELISILNECAVECNHCATACSEEQEAKMLARCIKLNNDCAEICRLAVSYLSRGSEHADHILNECGEICEACAKECEKHANMGHCKQCAKVCRKCMDACLQMA